MTEVIMPKKKMIQIQGSLKTERSASAGYRP